MKHPLYVEYSAINFIPTGKRKKYRLCFQIFKRQKICYYIFIQLVYGMHVQTENKLVRLKDPYIIPPNFKNKLKTLKIINQSTC